MAGLIPAIHAFAGRTKDVDARVKPGHDELGAVATASVCVDPFADVAAGRGDLAVRFRPARVR